MKIDKPSTPLPPVSTGETKARTSVKSSDNPPAAPPGGTSVNLGTTSAQLRSLESSMANSPSVNAAKVAEIKQAISEGRFKVNSGAVADSLIRSVTDLISTHRA